MQLLVETEIKLPVDDFDPLRRRLERLGFRPVERRHFESNILFDFPDRRLARAHCMLRLRFAHGRWLLTFKGTPRRSRSYKIRKELEIEIERGGPLVEILKALGFRETFRYEKYRAVYVPRNKSDGSRRALVLDETPIGNYIELEGPEPWIDAMARRLGYRHRDYITASYGALYRLKCKERGRKAENMVFKTADRDWVLMRPGL